MKKINNNYMNICFIYLYTKPSHHHKQPHMCVYVCVSYSNINREKYVKWKYFEKSYNTTRCRIQ